MIDAQDIVAILTETGVQTRRERAAFVAKLRDEMGLGFAEIGTQMNVSPQRAQQLYTLHKFFQRSANSPFADLSTRARNFLNNVGYYHKLPPDWEESPVETARMVQILTQMTRTEARKFRSLGSKTLAEIEDFMRQNGISFERGLDEAAEEEGELKGSDLTRGVSPEQSIQLITHFMNEKGLRGEFKLWPPGTYTGAYSQKADFVMTVSGFIGDAFEEGWELVSEFDTFVKGIGLHYEMATRTVLNFYQDPTVDWDMVAAPPQTPEQVP